MTIILWIFATVGFIIVTAIIGCYFINKINPPAHYSCGADGDWERYCDKCKGIYDPKTDRPIKKI